MPDDNWQKVREVFDAALQRPPARRAEFVREACGGDGALLAEVTSLLASLDGGEEFLETPAVGLVAISGNSLDQGQKLGHYEIVRAIGAGGMGEVYLAQDTRLGRRVAIKVLSDNFGQKAPDLDRFMREARSASALNHPNIMVVHEVGAEQGTHFIVSEYIDGRTLRDLLIDTLPPVNEAIDIAIQTAAGLAAAHKVHLVHRDIKPENIMVRPDGVVKVLDFGLSKLVEERNMLFLGTEDPTIRRQQTEKGVILGTIAYMSPEQARAKDIDERTDIWSLGVVLYEMLSGRSPFAAETTGDAISAILNRNISPLTGDGIPPELQRIVGKTLRKNREERYQHIRDLLIDLKDLKQEIEFEAKRSLSEPRPAGGGLPQETSRSDSRDLLQPPVGADGSGPIRPSSAEYIVGEIKQHKRAAAAIAAIVLTAAMGLGYWFYSNRTMAPGTDRTRSIAVLPLVPIGTANRDEVYEIGVANSLIHRLSSIKGLVVRPLSATRRYGDIGQDPLAAGREQQVDYVLASNYQLAAGKLGITAQLLNVASGQVEETYKSEKDVANLFAMQDAIAGEVGNVLMARFATTETKMPARPGTNNEEAYRLYVRGHFFANQDTTEGFRKALEHLNEAIKLDSNFALAYVAMAKAYHGASEWHLPPREAMPKARGYAEQAIRLDETLPDAHSALAWNKMFYDWDALGAEREFKRALELGPNHETGYAWLLSLMGRHQEAIAEVERVNRIDPLGGSGALVYYRVRQYDQAISRISNFLEIRPNSLAANQWLGLAYEQKGMFDEAFTAFQRAHQIDDTPDLRAFQARIQALSGKRSEAEKTLSELKEISRQRYISPYFIAIIHAALNENDEAFALLERAYQDRSYWLPGLQTNPQLDSLRGDARFADLARLSTESKRSDRTAVSGPVLGSRRAL